MAAVGARVRRQMVEQLASTLQTSPGFIITSFQALPVSAIEAFRRQLRSQQARYLVAKQTVWRRALEQLGLQHVTSLLEGPIGVVLTGPDPVATSKLLIDFVKDHETQLVIRGGLLDGAPLSLSTIRELAILPSRERLLATIAADCETLLSTIAQLAEALLDDVARHTEALAIARQQTAPAGAATTPPEAAGGAAETAPQEQAPPPPSAS